MLAFLGAAGTVDYGLDAFYGTGGTPDIGAMDSSMELKAAKAGSPGGDFVVAGASWGLWEADSFPKSVTHSLNTSCGDSGAFILRGSTSIWPHSGRNRVDEGGKSRQPRG
jgi:hypothetical protein